MSNVEAMRGKCEVYAPLNESFHLFRNHMTSSVHCFLSIAYVSYKRAHNVPFNVECSELNYRHNNRMCHNYIKKTLYTLLMVFDCL